MHCVWHRRCPINTPTGPGVRSPPQHVFGAPERGTPPPDRIDVSGTGCHGDRCRCPAANGSRARAGYPSQTPAVPNGRSGPVDLLASRVFPGVAVSPVQSPGAPRMSRSCRQRVAASETPRAAIERARSIAGGKVLTVERRLLPELVAQRAKHGVHRHDHGEGHEPDQHRDRYRRQRFQQGDK